MKEVNQYLKKGLTNKPLNKVKGVVIHWYASPKAKATNVIKYWEGQANGVNAHDCIDLDGTIFHAVPYNMMCYQVGSSKGYTKEAVNKLGTYPNNCVIGIECGHLDMTGKMTDDTYKSLVEHSAKLLKKFGLTSDNLWLHSEIVGKSYKDCHRWFTTTKPSDWPKFKAEVKAAMTPASKAVIKKEIVKEIKPVAKPVVKKATTKKVPLPSGVLKKGSKGSNVTLLQKAMNAVNFKTDVDGIYGSGTEDAVRRFQSMYVVGKADGVYGPNTQKALEKKLK